MIAEKKGGTIESRRQTADGRKTPEDSGQKWKARRDERKEKAGKLEKLEQICCTTCTCHPWSLLCWSTCLHLSSAGSFLPSPSVVSTSSRYLQATKHAAHHKSRELSRTTTKKKEEKKNRPHSTKDARFHRAQQSITHLTHTSYCHWSLSNITKKLLRRPRTLNPKHLFDNSLHTRHCIPLHTHPHTHTHMLH